MELPIKRTSKKKTETIDLTESFEYPIGKTQREYAGGLEASKKLYEIVKYKFTGVYPDYIERHKIKNRKLKRFLFIAHSYQLMTEKVSKLSESKLCFKDQLRSSLLAIPFKSEIPNILSTLHIENGVHFSPEETKERAAVFKVKWHRFKKEISAYISNCSCYSMDTKQVFKRAKL